MFAAAAAFSPLPNVGRRCQQQVLRYATSDFTTEFNLQTTHNQFAHELSSIDLESSSFIRFMNASGNSGESHPQSHTSQFVDRSHFTSHNHTSRHTRPQALAPTSASRIVTGVAVDTAPRAQGQRRAAARMSLSSPTFLLQRAQVSLAFFVFQSLLGNASSRSGKQKRQSLRLPPPPPTPCAL